MNELFVNSGETAEKANLRKNAFDENAGRANSNIVCCGCAIRNNKYISSQINMYQSEVH